MKIARLSNVTIVVRGVRILATIHLRTTSIETPAATSQDGIKQIGGIIT